MTLQEFLEQYCNPLGTVDMVEGEHIELIGQTQTAIGVFIFSSLKSIQVFAPGFLLRLHSQVRKLALFVGYGGVEDGSHVQHQGRRKPQSLQTQQPLRAVPHPQSQGHADIL
jgi:hypothetical protein